MLRRARARPVRRPAPPPQRGDAFLYAFDLLELDGTDLRREPIEVRKATLASILRKSRPGVRLNEHLEHDCGLTVFQHACQLGCEGIVSKRLGSRYRSGRSPDWLKFKNPEAPAVRREAEEDWGRLTNEDRSPASRGRIADASPMSRASLAASSYAAELQAIHRYVVRMPVLKAVTDEIRVVVETVWPELISKLPPKL